MSTRNTMPFQGRDRLLKAAAILEILSWESSRRIICYLQDNPEASFTDFLICTDLDAPALQNLLDKLERAKIVMHQETLLADFYYLNQTRLTRITALVASLD